MGFIKSYDLSSILKQTAEIIIQSNRSFFYSYDLSRLQVVVFFFPENVCESMTKAQHLFFDALNTAMNLYKWAC